MPLLSVILSAAIAWPAPYMVLDAPSVNANPAAASLSDSSLEFCLAMFLNLRPCGDTPPIFLSVAPEFNQHGQNLRLLRTTIITLDYALAKIPHEQNQQQKHAYLYTI
jgi:hypothetical protein